MKNLPRILGVSLIFGILAASHLRAGFDYAPDYDGNPLTADQKTKIKAAINKIKGAAKAGSEEEKCAKALCDMLEPPDPDGNGPQQPPPSRFCAESGPASRKVGAVTLGDGKAGSAGDKINVPDSSINGDCNILAAMMCHEWTHVNQTGNPATQELPAYKAEKAWLDALGVAHTNPRYIQICCMINTLEGKPDKKAKKTALPGGGQQKQQQMIDSAKTPQWGFANYFSNASSHSALFADESSGTIHGYFVDTTSTIQNDYVTQMTTVLNLLEMQSGLTGPDGFPIIAVFGMNEYQSEGYIEFIEFNTTTATVTNSLAFVTLKSCHPIDAVCGRVNGKAAMYILDTLGKRIRILVDNNNDGVPETELPAPYATNGGFPTLSHALSIGPGSGEAFAVSVSTLDGRIVDSPSAGDIYTNIIDLDGNGVADTSGISHGYEIVHMDPAPRIPAFGDTSVEVFGIFNTTIELWKFDPAGTVTTLLGSAVIGTDLSATISFATPLVAGEMLKIQDVTTNPPPPASVFRVGGWKNFGVSCGFGSVTPESGASGTSSIGGTLTLEGYGLQPNSTGISILGFTPTDLELSPYGAPGCHLYSSADITNLVATDADGHASLNRQIPASPGLVGLTIDSQWYTPAPGANALGFVFSDATKIQIGFP